MKNKDIDRLIQGLNAAVNAIPSDEEINVQNLLYSGAAVALLAEIALRLPERKECDV